jgi:predicted HicB family RNase H-like nuclease
VSRLPYVQMAVRVPRQLKERLEQAAAREGVHVSELVRLLLREGLDQPRATSAGSR